MLGQKLSKKFVRFLGELKTLQFQSFGISQTLFIFIDAAGYSNTV